MVQVPPQPLLTEEVPHLQLLSLVQVGEQVLQAVHFPQEFVEAQPFEQLSDVTLQSGLPLQDVHLPQELVEAHP